jgi:hypothetical protein
MSYVSLWKCDGNTEPDPTKPPKWCEKLAWPGIKSWTKVDRKTKEDRHLCPGCDKNRVKLPIPEKETPSYWTPKKHKKH